MEEKKQKPLPLIIKEARENIATAINDTELNPVLLEPIIKDFYNEVKVLSERQYEMDLKEYQDNEK